ELRVAVAETYDVIVEPSGQDAFTIFAQSMDRTGFARGTLAVREGLSAPVPEPDPRPLLTMADMGHGGMGHGDMASPDMGNQMPGSEPPAADPHSGHTRPGQTAPEGDPHSGHDMPGMGGMQTHPASEEGNPLVDMQT